MLAREVFPGTLVLVDEETVWRELMFGIRPEVTSPTGVTTIMPGNKALCLVEDLSVHSVGQEPLLVGSSQ
jgi:hypothetical protein